MSRLRSQLDPDQQSADTRPTSFKTEVNEYEVRCGMCGRLAYVDEETLKGVQKAIAAGADNPFVCEICDEEYDDLAYGG
ncbi:MAG TPA: hypothetical protein VMM84_09045 [Pyrinomonadaceae bacterium]|nr:hypothetical protein [Pyrinomonadaceae bacterium]